MADENLWTGGIRYFIEFDLRPALASLQAVGASADEALRKRRRLTLRRHGR